MIQLNNTTIINLKNIMIFNYTVYFVFVLDDIDNLF